MGGNWLNEVFEAAVCLDSLGSIRGTLIMFSVSS